jgi:hypothetical protein
MKDQPGISGLIYRLFLLSWILSVLWVKGYLWWIFGVSIVLFVAHLFSNVPISSTPAATAQPRPATKRSSAKRSAKESGDSWREPLPSR